jgi:dolichol kinase
MAKLLNDLPVRTLLHIPIGFVIGLAACFPFISAGRVILHLFIRYEESEDKHLKDQAWKDYYGAIIGAVIAYLVFSAAVIYAFVRWVL